MITRAVEAVLRNRLANYPAVALDGPRQSGKTTLARSLNGLYFDIEQQADQTRLDLKWSEIVKDRQLVVLDEAQQCPEIFPRLRGAIDNARDRTGRFLLLGSVSPALKMHVSESLAGRLALVELTPFLLAELSDIKLDDLWLHGGYPEGGAPHPKRFPKWQLDYLSLLAQRDLPTWGLPAKPQVTDRLLRMIAAVHGRLWNASQIGQALGLSHTTVNNYVDYLEGAFLVRRLLPYSGNLKKRLVRSPRLYWRDTGLLHAMLRVQDYHDLLGQPWVGFSWEGFVIEQILGTLQNLDCQIDPCFFRTSDGYEIDLMFRAAGKRWAIEIKLAAEASPDDLARLNKAADMVAADMRILVTQSPESTVSANQGVCNLPDFLQILKESE
ncbi:MAG: ATP-binding protein [Lentisphaerae bacterium]|nr:ATP-binding protein [Lentisphaerota bacterium]